MSLLEVKNLQVRVEDREILHGLSLTVNLFCDNGQFLLSTSWQFLSGTFVNVEKNDLFSYEDGSGPYNYPVGSTVVAGLSGIVPGLLKVTGTCCPIQ